MPNPTKPVSRFALRCALALALHFTLIGAAHAQSEAKSTAQPARRLTAEENRGEGLFLQRCSLCHLPRHLKFGEPAVIGPSLSGLFKNTDGDQQKFLTNFILKGDAKMPGFQYGLNDRQLQELIAYLKTQ